MDDQTLQEIHRLALENNRMLHSMRRNAFLSGLVRLIVYAVLVIVPLWFYYVYMAPVVNSMLQTMQQIQGTGAQAQANFSSLEQAWKEFQQKLRVGAN